MRLHPGLLLWGAVAIGGCGEDFTSERTPTGGSTGTTTSSAGGASSGDGGAGGSSSSSAGGGTGGKPLDLDHEVRVRDQGGTGVAAVPVLVYDADGAVVETAETSADGTVTLEIPADGSVAAFWLEPDGSRRVLSVHQPPSGAKVVFSVVGPPANAPTSFSFQLFSAPAGTTNYVAKGDCDSQTGSSTTIALDNAGCTFSDIQSFLFIAEDATKPLGWATRENVPVNPGGIVMDDVHVSMTTFVESELQLVGAPADAASGFLGGTVRLGKVAHTESDSISAPANNPLNVPVRLPSGGQLDLAVLFGLNFGGANGATVFRVEPMTNWPATVAVDASTLARPSVMPPDLGEPNHPKLAWQSTDPSQSDWVAASYQWKSAGVELSWQAMMPAGATSVRLGDVPDSLAGYRPSDSYESVVVTYVASDALQGYEEAVGLDGGSDSLPGAFEIDEARYYAP